MIPLLVRSNRHEEFMRECLRLALKGRGSVSPNPMVGAVLTRAGKVVARGYHREFGGPHAEVSCIRRAGEKARGATLYVNLEPCSHFGQTPPCTDLIIKSGIREVFVGLRDPNPLVSGRGIRKLRSAGIRVHTGILEADARELNRFFVRHIVRRSPYVHVKIAQSLDGMIAGLNGKPRWITSRPSRTLVHHMRSEYDAVLVGAGTILADNPRLTTRLATGRNPDVVILDGRLRVSASARVIRKVDRRRVILCSSLAAVQRHRRRVRELTRKGVLVLPFVGDRSNISLKAVLRTLYRLKIGSLLVEGGRTIFTEFLEASLADEVSIFVAPMVLGSGVNVINRGITIPESRDGWRVIVRRVGKDMIFNNQKV